MKIAILLHGLVGTLQDRNEKHKLINGNVDYDTKKDSNVVLKKGWESYSKNFDNCDYYVHSWNTELEKEIIELYKPIKYKLEEQIKFQAPQEHKGSNLRWINHRGRFYSLKQTIEMCLSKNIKYDYYMISRFDLVFKKKFDFSNLSGCVISKWWNPHRVDKDKKVNDFWFVFDYDSLQKFYSKLDNIESYMLHSQTNVGTSPHYTFQKLLKDINVNEYLSYFQDNPEKSDYCLVRNYKKVEKVLIGVGCSHTSGCACIIGSGTEHREYELASKELKEKYGKETVSTKWITENFSWIGHLGNLLGVDKKLNFGFGGKGVEQCVLALRNYSFLKKDLSNHIIVFQIPSLWRIDILHKNKKGEYWLSPSSGLIHSDKVIDFFDKYYDKNFYQYKFVYELYFIQEYLKLLGAKVFFIDMFCPSLNDGIPTEKDHSKIILDASNLKPNWESDITQVIDYEVLIKNLNIVKLGQIKLNQLSDENLLNDNHFSESGNKGLAEAIYKGIKNEKTSMES